MPNNYDRILKENMEAAAPTILRDILGQEWERADLLKDRLHVTLERETDFLLHLDKGDKSRERVVHLEFQLKSGKALDQRMLLYHSLLGQKYSCPIEQAVIFLQKAPKKPPERHWIRRPHLTFSYPVFYLNTIPFEELLLSDVPEAVVLSILSDFGDLPPEAAIKNILDRLHEQFGETFSMEKYVNQIRVLSNIRQLAPIFHQQLEQMPSLIKINKKTDPFYLEGIKEGISVGKAEGFSEGHATAHQNTHAVIAWLLGTGQFSAQEIAQQSKVPLELVLSVEAELGKRS